MANASTLTPGSISSVGSTQGTSENYLVPLVVLTSLFFMWGLITVLNDILIPHLKAVFDLSYFKAMAVNFCFFGAYGVVSYPAGKLVKKVGYKTGVVIGLIVASAGCLLFYPAASVRVYGVFLAALFVLASGITILQVSANPYVTLLGPAETGSRRLTLTQAFNSLGTFIGPSIGTVLILSVATLSAAQLAGMSAEEVTAHQIAQAKAVQLPYIILAGILCALAVAFALFKLPRIVDEDQDSQASTQTAWDYKHLVLGAVGIFVYVGGEVSIGSLIINFLAESHIAGLSHKDAGFYVSLYWGGAMVGRFAGVGLMFVIAPARLLAIFASLVIVLLLSTSFTTGSVAMWSVLAIGLFNSIMFPTIFSLAIKKLGPATSQGSGILCVAIVGGAFIPPLQGLLADQIGLQMSFLLPILCYAYIVFYGLKGSEIKN